MACVCDFLGILWLVGEPLGCGSVEWLGGGIRLFRER